MRIALAFLLPVLAYFAIYFLITRDKLAAREHLGAASAAGAFLVALISSVVVFLTLVNAPHWPGRTQVAWTGVEVIAQPLVVGGAREQAAFGWPNDSFAPTLKATAASEGALALEMTGGEAFIRDDRKDVFLNGSPIPPAGSKAVGDFTIKVEPSYYLWHRVDIIGDDGQAWAGFPLPAALIKRDRVYSVAALADEHAVEGVRADVGRMLRLERWAADLRLLVTRRGELRLLETAAEQSQCELPCELSVLWPRRRLPVTLTKEGIKLRMDFPPPRHLVSPLLPADDGGWTPLVLTGDPLPGDRAMLLPLGRGVADPRQPISFRNNAKGLPIFDMPAALVYGEGGIPELPEHMQPRPGDSSRVERNVTSRVGVHSPPHSFHFATVNDLPDFWLIARLFFYALACFGFGLAVAYNRMPDDKTRWVIYGLAAVFWNFLAFRLLLSFRYALSPVSLDLLAVKGVRLAFVGLAVAPGLMLLFVRLRRDLFERPDGARRKKTLMGTLLFFFALVVAGVLAYTQAPDIWVNSPSRPLGPTDFLWLGAVAAAAAYLFLLVFVLYRIEPTRSRAQQKTAEFFFWPLRAIEGIARTGKGVWARALPDAKPWRWPMLAAFVLFAAALVLMIVAVPAFVSFVAGMVSMIVPIETFLNDIILPLAFYWPLALILLASRMIFPPGSRQTSLLRLHKSAPLRRKLLRVFLVVLMTVGATVFFVPVAIGDAGSIMGILSIMIPTALVIMASRPRRWGALVALTLGLGFAAAAAVYVNIRSVSPILPSVAASRILVFKEYGTLQRYLPFEERGQLQKLRDGYQHTWENQAIAHEGGYTGLGFGYAPTRRSQVRQDTIQYDSVFSFFIVAEYGLLGGVCLLLLCGLPLALILVGGRTRFDFGYAVATVVTSSFLLESLIHAAMNFNLFPFTGRDLPLLTVNSFTDLLRWTILLSLAAQAALFRYRGKSALREDADSFISPESAGAQPEPLRAYLPAAGLVAAVPALVLVALVWTGAGIIRDKNLDKPFSWSGILDVIDAMGRQGLLFVKEDKTVGVSPSMPTSPGMLIEQEIARFNALADDERMGDATLTKYEERIKALDGAAAYDQLLDQIRTESPDHDGSQRVSLFKLLPPRQWDDGNQLREVGGPRVVANRAFNTQLSFKSGFSEEEFPRTTLRDNQILIGPAWVMGRWVQLYDPRPPIPWTAHLTGALKGEWARLGTVQAAAAYGRLSLQQRLQEAAAAFAAEKGRGLYDNLLRGSAVAKSAGRKLPPRVAVAVVGLPTGETLALGGWPRMSASRFWTRGPDGRDWVPPYDWAEREAPQAMRSLYGGDRNFDLMVMGSATKPMWASAALRVHPQLDQKLQTQGGEEREADVFGIELVQNAAGGWDAGPRGWVDFKNYLAKSDNRYHVRLGFLGLAEQIGGDVIGEGVSNSVKESLRGRSPAPWKRFPRFPPEINFSHLQPGPMSRINETPLAKHLLNMYGIGVTKNYFGRRISFWTKNQEHDLTRAVDAEDLAPGFEFISPAAVDLELDQLKTARDYVTLLLGGGTNLWANADFAAAFGTCVTGRPVIAHIVKSQQPVRTLPEREEFAAVAQSLRPGLMAVVSKDGTGNAPELLSAAASFQRQGYAVYAKTGTLAAQEGERETSRIVLAIIRWENEAQGKAKTGVVFSVVGERAGVRMATQWLGEFINRNRAEIERVLNEMATGQ